MCVKPNPGNKTDTQKRKDFVYYQNKDGHALPDCESEESITPKLLTNWLSLIQFIFGSVVSLLLLTKASEVTRIGSGLANLL